MHRFLVLAFLMLFGAALPASAQLAAEELPIFYVVRQEATVFSQADSTRPYVSLGLREPVFLLAKEGRWMQIRTHDGAQGYVYASALSNTWIRVSKRKRSLFLYRGTTLVKEFPADFGYNAFADKERRGSTLDPDHWRTPEGTFYVAKKNAGSKYHRALVLNYPNAEDAERGLKAGLITIEEFNAIHAAEVAFTMPPMSTALGGYIEIHGSGTGVRTNWTQGCVALHNAHIDELWRWADVGTPVVIEP